MAKKKNRTNTEDSTETQKEEGCSAKKQALEKSSNEIDKIFSGKKRKKSDDVKKATKAKKSKKSDEGARDIALGDTAPKRRRKTNKSEDYISFGDTAPKSRRKTNDGFTIYSEEELRINKSHAGGTSLCPFDCDCCF